MILVRRITLKRVRFFIFSEYLDLNQIDYDNDNVNTIFYQCITDVMLISFNKLITLNNLYYITEKNLYRYHQIIRNRYLP